VPNPSTGPAQASDGATASPPVSSLAGMNDDFVPFTTRSIREHQRAAHEANGPP
jgi:hypothetical protein